MDTKITINKSKLLLLLYISLTYYDPILFYTFNSTKLMFIYPLNSKRFGMHEDKKGNGIGRHYDIDFGHLNTRSAKESKHLT